MKIAELLGKIRYICRRMNVERFVLLATTGKNAKMIVHFFLPCLPYFSPLASFAIKTH
jgi:hypothetical protein